MLGQTVVKHVNGVRTLIGDVQAFSILHYLQQSRVKYFHPFFFSFSHQYALLKSCTCSLSVNELYLWGEFYFHLLLLLANFETIHELSVFYIVAFIICHDWLFSLGLTGERVCPTPPALSSSLLTPGHRHSCGIAHIRTCDYSS